MTIRSRGRIGSTDYGMRTYGPAGSKSRLESALAAYRADGPSPSSFRRWQHAAEFRRWLEQDALRTLTLDQACLMYSACGGRKAKGFGSNALEEIREAFDFLLYDPLSLEGRFSECVTEGSAYELKGSNKAFISYLLCVKDPLLFGVWTPSSDKGLAMLGFITPKERSASPGTKYVRYLDLLWGLRRTAGMADFQELDRFLFWMAKIKE